MNKTGLVPLGYKVLIKVKELEEKTKGGIIIPKSSIEKEEEAHQFVEIIDYGPAAFTTGAGDLANEWDIIPKVGDTALINKYSGIRFEKEGMEGKYRLVNDKEILAILNEK